MHDYIKIRGARQHNLKNVNLDLPKNRLIVFTGISGSGKSSMAFDTIYAEGQRRYVESLSPYARQFLGIMDKPDVDSIEGLSPAISIDQKTTSKNPRSTVATITEIYDFLRLLYAKIGHPHCPICNREISKQSLDEIVSLALDIIVKVLEKEVSAKFYILSPVVIGKKGEFPNLFENLKSKGYDTLRIDGQIRLISEDLYLIKTNKHTIEVVIDKISLLSKNLKSKSFKEEFVLRLRESIEQALKLSDGLVILTQILDKSLDFPKYPKFFSNHLFSERFACPLDNIQIPEIEPRTFSFNSPYGACPKCLGIGKVLKINPDLIISPELSITEGAIKPYSYMFENDTWYSRIILKVCEAHNINPKIPFKNLSKEQKEIILYGTGDQIYKVEGINRFGKKTFIYEIFNGIVNDLEKKYKESQSEGISSIIARYMQEQICNECNGTRLRKEALAITVNAIPINTFCDLSIDKALEWIGSLKKENVLSKKEKEIATPILYEIEERLKFLISVGLDYLTLSRESTTLSAGESQRIRLASQIGSGLTGVLYVLDEPTIGLHQRDNLKLINTIKKLRDQGNTIIVVEHDEEMIRNADYIVDFGPMAGKEGGEIVAVGKLEDIQRCSKSITGKYLSQKLKIESQIKNNKKIIDDNKYLAEANNYILNKQAFKNQKFIKIYGCCQNNLKNIDVEIPLGKLVAITGVSGSGKSSLLVETLYPALVRELNPNSNLVPGKFSKIEGISNIDKVLLIDQSPIGRTPRSNPVTYTKVFDLIREVFANTREAKIRGFKKSRFSFNVKGGRCEACEGQGEIKIEMQFMSDIWVKCDVCGGKRYNSQTLEVYYQGKNIYDVLRLTVKEAMQFFKNHPKILNKLKTLSSVGLDYIELGQPATTLSGGEAQRIKLAAELNKKPTGKTIYILDEPTTGLHFYDIQNLLNVLRLLVEGGNTVLIIEHNLNIIKNSDWVIDLGPDGGEKGGEVVASGTIEDIKKSKRSYTGLYL